MGNDANSGNGGKDIGTGKLKIQKYPENIPEEEWIPADSCSKSKQQKEVTVSLNGDQRIRAKPEEYIQKNNFNEDNKINDDKKNNYTHPIYNIVRLKMKYSHHYAFGSGTIIHHTLNKVYVLTAAHNVVIADEYDAKQVEYPEAVWMEINENTSSAYKTIKRYNCSHYSIHPQYINFLQQSNIKESATGYDIAIIEVSDPENALRSIKPMKLRLFESKMTDSMKVKVIGYPGEAKLRGQLYGMKGDGEIKYINDKIKYNKLTVYNNIDTSGGQSGSPIFRVLTDENKNNDEKRNYSIFQSFDEIVGVHVAGKNTKKLNFGTMLNDKMLRWIYECVDGDCIKYDKYNVSVLLITSSKAKYARRLNQIYKKCVKTEIMSTRRLYYDYNEQSVNQQDFLFYIEKMFDERKKTCLIFYCGESENGNWIINNTKSDNITLNDISICAKRKANNSKLYIVSDCNHSGNWVQKFTENENKFNHINGIQASSKHNEVCNAGTFTSKYAQCCFGYDAGIHRTGTAKVVGGLGMGGLGALTVGTLYDGVIKQPFHKATKQSQPSSTASHAEFFVTYYRNGMYKVELNFFSSWYMMDLTMTAAGAMTVGSAGSLGHY